MVVHEPGTRKGWSSKVWPSVEQQVKDAQRQNREYYARSNHETVQLYLMESDCPHEPPPIRLKKFADVYDVARKWAEDSLGLSRENPYSDSVMRQAFSDMYWKNLVRARVAVPLVREYYQADYEHARNHSNGVCLDNPQGFACSYCDDIALENGDRVSDPGCALQSTLEDQQDEFWYGASEEAQEWRDRNEH